MSEQIDAKDALLVGDVHQPRHQLDRLEVLNGPDEQVDGLLGLEAEENVRVLVDHVGHLGHVDDTLEVVQRLVVVFLGQVVDDDHLDVALLVGELDQVLDAPVRHHYQVHQVLVYYIQVVHQKLLQARQFLVEFVLGLDAFLALKVALLPLQVV